MKNVQSRILPYTFSQKLNDEDLSHIAAAGTTGGTLTGTFTQGRFDAEGDGKIDL